MGDRLFVSEYVEGTRTAQLLQRRTEQDYVVYCFCCGHEAESEPFGTLQLAEDWAEDWVQKTVELEALVDAVGPDGCGCQD
jgi:hypothetical protein